MLKTIIIMSLLLWHLPLSAKSVSMDEILKLKTGDRFVEAKKKLQGLKLSDSLEGAIYEIETDKEFITSIYVDFSTPVSPDKFISKDTKGFCLSQPMAPDMPMLRTFFFDMNTHRRYEINPKGKIKSIIIQDIPGARSNRECKFGEAHLKKSQSEMIKKMK